MPLDAFDASISPPASRPPVIPLGDADRLRRLQRQLRSAGRVDPAAPELVRLATCDLLVDRLSRFHAVDEPPPGPRHTTLVRRPPAWGVTLLLATGGFAVAVGLMLLVAANLLLHAPAWRWGFAVAFAGETLLLAGIAGMALRLWRNSRRLNAQLEGLDRRLDAVQSTIAPPGGRPLEGRITRAAPAAWQGSR